MLGRRFGETCLFGILIALSGCGQQGDDVAKEAANSTEFSEVMTPGRATSNTVEVVLSEPLPGAVLQGLLVDVRGHVVGDLSPLQLDLYVDGLRVFVRADRSFHLVRAFPSAGQYDLKIWVRWEPDLVFESSVAVKLVDNPITAKQLAALSQTVTGGTGAAASRALKELIRIGDLRGADALLAGARREGATVRTRRRAVRALLRMGAVSTIHELIGLCNDPVVYRDAIVGLKSQYLPDSLGLVRTDVPLSSSQHEEWLEWWAENEAQFRVWLHQPE